MGKKNIKQAKKWESTIYFGFLILFFASIVWAIFRSNRNKPSCGIYNGKENAKITWYNEDNEYQATYFLKISVKDCKVESIYFPDGRVLDQKNSQSKQLNSNHRTILIDRGFNRFYVAIDQDE